jgi:N utilization substance protein B
MVMQALYEWDFRGRQGIDLDKVVNFVKSEFGPNFDDSGYVEHQVKNIIDHKDVIDAMLNQFTPNWKVDTMTLIDRNILRLGAYELKLDETIPSIVAINEAIELGKTFGGEASGKFVNGVLGAIYKDMQQRGVKKQIDIEMEQKKQAKGQSVPPAPT